ncbi:MAG: 5-formyltetrahydrofolate cyclo-ligase [Clostridia bacterium]|nr:5-formyltetrahydrofolate cyclo-ligase [Clostridia bacterium]
MNTVKKEKDDLREKYIAKRREMDKAEKERRDAAISNAAKGLVSFRYAEYVLLYAATENEIDVSDIARFAWEQGKKVAFPRCDTADHTMEYHIVGSLDELKVDSYGIREPSADAPVFRQSETTASAVCFVPGLVYDRSGYRLGYGKGFYDRYLSAFPGCKIGVVYSDYVIGSVPRGRYDVTVDILLTEKGVKALK